ncbi:MAG: hypothetical protein KatS3mg082_2352 [Nitrospiraceae bacterium]|nr:MAG: hypothetical protein KatS3mg082_2352 [Nitrospiraceae bacterium]
MTDEGGDDSVRTMAVGTERERSAAQEGRRIGRQGRGAAVATALAAALLWGGVSAPVAHAIRAESPKEKAENLKQQAEAGLFKLWNFDRQAVGSVPLGFSPLNLGDGPPGTWQVQTDATAFSAPNVVLSASRCPSEACYRLLVADDLKYEYPDLTMHLRSGSDGGRSVGGVVFGVLDAKNFYAAVVDLAQPSLEVIRVVDGKESVLGRATVKLKPLPWHTLRVQRNTIISKDFIETFVDGEMALAVEDQALGLGQVGLVARGDSTVQFDNFHAIPLFSQRPLSPPAAY